jgi:hypothetical protein
MAGLPPSSYKTYQIAAPISTHWRPASCAEVECPNYLHGWKVRADVLDEKMIHTATHSGRKFVWQRLSELENWLVYEAGQPCFQAAVHRVRVDRPELYIVREGDRRGNPRSTGPVQLSSVNWVDDFSEHQASIAGAVERG